MDLSIIPNLITLVRLLLIVPVAVSILEQHFGLALALFAVASISDGIDGFLARKFNWISRFGSILDPIADKLLLVTVFLLLVFTGYLPTWLAYIVIGRDLVILAGAATYHILFGEYELAPTFLGKCSTTFQFVLVLLTLMSLSIYPVPEDLLNAGIWIVTVVSSLSGLDYILTWSRKAADAARSHR